MMRNLRLLFILLSFTYSSIFAQDFMGYRQSNYSGVTGGDLNPANIADSRFVVDVTLGAASMSAYNNHLYFNPHKMPYWWSQSFDTADLAVQNWQ